MIFDIKSFHPSIRENLFVKPNQFAKKMTQASDEDINLIMESRKILSFTEDMP